MLKADNKTYTIRNFKDSDADKIAEFDILAMLRYRFNKDYEPVNIFCAIGEKDEILGVGHLVPDQTWFLIETGNKPEEYVYKLSMDITIHPDCVATNEIKGELYQVLLERAKELRANFPNKRVKVSCTVDSDELEEMDFILSKGFLVERNHLIMKRDLTEEIPAYPLPENIEIKNWKMESATEQEQYLQAEASGDDGLAWSLNNLRWTMAGSEWDTFTAFDGEKVVGSCMTWGISDVRSATEQIFVLPEWRRKGIARAVIAESLRFLKDNGKTEATLGVFSENGKAIALYLSLGYKMNEIIVEFGLEI